MIKILPSNLRSTIYSLQSILTSCFVIVVSCFIFKTHVSAQSKISLVVSPPRYNIDAKPGEIIQKTIKVTNSSDSPVTISASVSDFIVMDDKGTPVKVTAISSGRYLASPWFKLDDKSITIEPQATREIVVVITVPQDALPGGHYSGVFFEPQSSDQTAGSASFLAAQVGSLFGITIAGDIKYDALIKDFGPTMRFYEYGPVDFKAEVENQSDTHITPSSSVIIKDMFGRTLDTITGEELNIFPYTSRTIPFTWEEVWGLGRYSATLMLAYGPGLTAERTVYFWLMPWKIVAAVLILIAVIIVITISLKRHLRHRQDDRDEQIDELKRRIVELENHQ